MTPKRAESCISGLNSGGYKVVSYTTKDLNEQELEYLISLVTPLYISWNILEKY